jgi:hypothetical protein
VLDKVDHRVPLTKNDFRLAMLLRLGRCTKNDLRQIDNVFNDIDSDGSGALDPCARSPLHPLHRPTSLLPATGAPPPPPPPPPPAPTPPRSSSDPVLFARALLRQTLPGLALLRGSDDSAHATPGRNDVIQTTADRHEVRKERLDVIHEESKRRLDLAPVDAVRARHCLLRSSS